MKPYIFGMVIPDLDYFLFSVCLKITLVLYHIIGGDSILGLHIFEITVVIREYCICVVALLGRSYLQLVNETWYELFQIFYRDTFTWISYLSEFSMVDRKLGPPSTCCNISIHTSFTPGGIHYQ